MSALLISGPSAEGSGTLAKGAFDVDEEQATSQERGLEPGTPARAEASTDGVPASPVTAAADQPAGPTAGHGRESRRRFPTRTTGIVGVVALVVVACVLGAAALSGFGSAGNIRIVLAASHSAAAVSGAEITVTGSGQVEGTPDTANFSVGVNTTASSAVAALERNNVQVA